MAEAIEVRTDHDDASGVVEELAPFVDDVSIRLPSDAAVPDGEWVRFVVLLADGSPFIEGVGRCQGGPQPDGRLHLSLLQFDERNEIMYERLLLAGQDDGEATGTIDLNELGAIMSAKDAPTTPPPPPPSSRPAAGSSPAPQPPRPAPTPPPSRPKTAPPPPNVSPARTAPRPKTAPPPPRPNAPAAASARPAAIPPRPKAPAIRPGGPVPAAPAAPAPRPGGASAAPAAPAAPAPRPGGASSVPAAPAAPPPRPGGASSAPAAPPPQPAAPPASAPADAAAAPARPRSVAPPGASLPSRPAPPKETSRSIEEAVVAAALRGDDLAREGDTDRPPPGEPAAEPSAPPAPSTPSAAEDEAMSWDEDEGTVSEHERRARRRRPRLQVPVDDGPPPLETVISQAGPAAGEIRSVAVSARTVAQARALAAHLPPAVLPRKGEESPEETVLRAALRIGLASLASLADVDDEL